MRRMALLAALATAASLAIAVPIGASGALAPGEIGGKGGQKVLGTWLVDVRPAEGEPLQAMITFSPGGGLVEIETSGPGTALGSWKSRGRGRVAFTFQGFLFDAEGAFSGRFVVRSEVTVRGGEFSGPFEFEVFDAAGNVVASGEGTATARRFRVQPLGG